MRKIIVLLFLLALVGGGIAVGVFRPQSTSYSAIEAAEENVAGESAATYESAYEKKRRELENWKRPEGPFKVALQAGHWKSAEAPDEFPNLAANTGTSGGGKAEWQVNLEIAEKTKSLLEAQGIVVDILPATVPPEYFADLFIAIHADGNANGGVAGYKAAAPRRELSGRAAAFVPVLEDAYRRATGLVYDPNVTRNMRGYYAFNWRRYRHALHPMTTGVILETGFLTNAADRRVIVHGQEKAAAGIADAILQFKTIHGL